MNTSITSRRAPPRRLSARRQAARGFALLEALVAFLIFTVGVLGLVGLQASMSRAQGGAYFRGTASYLATELLGTMWGDRVNLASYTGSSCAGYARCNQWLEKVGRALPGGAATVTTVAGVVTVNVTWQLPNGGTHRHVAEAQVAF